MKTTPVGKEIVYVATSWLKKWSSEQCSEKTDNVIYCNSGKVNFSNYHKDKNAWCAAFVSAVVKVACERAGVKLLTKLSAGTYALRENNRKIHIVDKKPVPGAIAVLTYTGGTTGHAAVIVEVTDSYIYTIEGNTGDNICLKQYTHEEFLYNKGKTNHKGYDVIHTELMDLNNTTLVSNIFDLDELADYNVKSCKSITTKSDDWQGKDSSPSSNYEYATKRNYFIRL